MEYNIYNKRLSSKQPRWIAIPKLQDFCLTYTNNPVSTRFDSFDRMRAPIRGSTTIIRSVQLSA